MNAIFRLLLVSAVFLGAFAVPTAAQSGLALKGHYVYNRSAVEAGQRLPAADGFGLGAEFVLPFGLGVGVTGYTSGHVSEFSDDSNVVGLAEANYFLKLPLLPLAPYVGVHAGLGTYTREDVGFADRPRLRDTHTYVGYQFGVRFQPISVIGFDAQYRRVSDWAAGAQDTRFERGQVLLGVTLF
ncbi:MAG TPA: hypothetical protein VGR27_01140 [Longimicrobiaceae bacterium]|nr:hypothetical protein [Longimicrobiaceae bacterium]